MRTMRLTLRDLQGYFKKYTITTTVMCAGNRRSEMKAVKEVRGLNWEGGALGTATFGGVRLRDVLRHAGTPARGTPLSLALCDSPSFAACNPASLCA